MVLFEKIEAAVGSRIKNVIKDSEDSEDRVEDRHKR
jgi:hypothetical protein